MAIVAVQMQFSGAGGAWTDVSVDVRLDSPLIARYGISGNGPNDRIADIGTLTFLLDNSKNNSGGITGYYSPEHGSARAGFAEGIGVRLTISDGTLRYKFRGTLISIDPLPGLGREQFTQCIVVDWMDEASRQKVTGVAAQAGQRADQLITTIVANITRQSAATSYAAGSVEFPYALDDLKDEETTTLEALRRVVDSDLGWVFQRGDTVQGGTLEFQDRRTRQNAGASAITISHSMLDMMAVRKREVIFNRVKAIVHPRKIDATATTVLYALDQSNPPAIAAGETITLVSQYRDPAQLAVRVGGTDMVTPVADTDYSFGSGPGDTSLTANLGIVASYGGNGVTYALTNNGSVAGYVTLLQARGRGLYDFAPLALEASDAASKTDYGEQVLTMDLPYESSVTNGQSYADYYLSKFKDPRTYIDSFRFVADQSAALMTAALSGEPGDLVTVSEAVTGLASIDYFINGATLTIGYQGLIECEWVLVPRIDTGSYWILNTSLLNTSTILAL